MRFEQDSILIIIGAFFLLLGIIGGIKIKGATIPLLKNFQKILLAIIGIVFLSFGLINKLDKNSFNESREEILNWEGEWSIVWNYWGSFDNPNKINEERIMKLEVVGKELIGSYPYVCDGRFTITSLYDMKIIQNRLIGKYKGYFVDDKSDYENGVFELMLYLDKSNFIGRFKRRKPNKNLVDNKYRIWVGRKLD